MKTILLFSILIHSCIVNAQELYVFSEPASNRPAKSITAKLANHFITGGGRYDRFSQRLMPQVMIGVSKKLMIHLGGTFSDMHTSSFRYESSNLYVKYRFISKDDIHRHFRMAVFADGAVTRSPFHYDEISLMGDKTGVEAGIIATQLWNKFALSATVSHTQALDKSRNDKVIYVPERLYQSMNYSLSGGLLIFPKKYTDFKQTNLNLYAEVLAQQSLDASKHCIDLAPALQLIFNSNSKLNVGYRFQVSGNMYRMATNSWQVSFERTFLNGWGNRKKENK